MKQSAVLAENTGSRCYMLPVMGWREAGEGRSEEKVDTRGKEGGCRGEGKGREPRTGRERKRGKGNKEKSGEREEEEKKL